MNGVIGLVVIVLVLSFLFSGRGHSRHAHGGGTRRAVAVHEAAHTVIARQHGSASATITANGRGHRGRTNYSIDGTAVDEAVIAFAGSIASKRMTGDPALRGSNDIAQARALLRGTGVSERQARAEASRLVSRHAGQIRRAAARLERDGRI